MNIFTFVLIQGLDIASSLGHWAMLPHLWIVCPLIIAVDVNDDWEWHNFFLSFSPLKSISSRLPCVHRRLVHLSDSIAINFPSDLFSTFELTHVICPREMFYLFSERDNLTEGDSVSRCLIRLFRRLSLCRSLWLTLLFDDCLWSLSFLMTLIIGQDTERSRALQIWLNLFH